MVIANYGDDFSARLRDIAGGAIATPGPYRLNSKSEVSLSRGEARCYLGQLIYWFDAAMLSVTPYKARPRLRPLKIRASLIFRRTHFTATGRRIFILTLHFTYSPPYAPVITAPPFCVKRHQQHAIANWPRRHYQLASLFRQQLRRIPPAYMAAYLIIAMAAAAITRPARRLLCRISILRWFSHNVRFIISLFRCARWY